MSMTLFCLLWVPFFYLFWRSISGNTSAQGVWAFLVGSVVALLQFFLGPMVEPGGFDLSRWASGCIDIVVLPALAPLLVCFILYCLKMTNGSADFANFALLWLIPGAALRALSWSSLQDPIFLVLVPVLWTAIIVGVSLFIVVIQNSRVPVKVLSFLAIFIIPFAAASSYWAFYSQKTNMGIIFLAVAAAPMFVFVVLSFFLSTSED